MRVVIAFVLVLLAISSAAHAQEKSDEPFHFALGGGYLFGSASGQVQTPAGGEPGTTIVGRPSLSELGIDNVEIYEVNARFSWGDHHIFGGWQGIRLDGSATLDQTLISQGQTFPAGTHVDAKVRPDWYDVGYAHRFAFDSAAHDDLAPVAIYPGVGIAFLDFSVDINGDNGAQVSRSYIKPAPLLGVGVEWPITNRFAIVGDVMSTLPFSDWPWIFSAEVAGRYEFVRDSHFSASAILGVRYEHIEYDDSNKQDVPNDLLFDLGPMLHVGLEVRF